MDNGPSIQSDLVRCSIRHVPRQRAARALLELFYPVHYTAGMKVEDTLRSSEALDRQQAIILWLIRSQGENGVLMRRKYIVNAMTGWYDITSTSISKALRSLAKAPLSLITIEEHPDSGREKLVKLTTKGKKFIRQMVENGTALTRWFLDQMSAQETDICLYIYSRTNKVFADISGQRKQAARSTAGAPSVDVRTPCADGDRPAPVAEKGPSLIDVPHVPRELGPMMQLDCFFPIHYQAGHLVEDALRSGISLSRQQVIILWLIHAEGDDRKKMRRKNIEKALLDWYEITSSSISKAIRSLNRAPLRLLTIEEHPDSGREKLVLFTLEGEQFVEKMLDNGTVFLEKIIDRLSGDEIDMLLHIFSRTSEIFDNFPGPFRSARPVLAPQI